MDRPGREGVLRGSGLGGNEEVAKVKVEYACTACGFSSPKGLGKCPGCGQGGSLVGEGAAAETKSRVASEGFPASKPVCLTEVTESASERARCGIAEFDRVMGGAVGPSSATLIGGDPGVGKTHVLIRVVIGH